MARLELRDITKRFGRAVAVDRVSVEVTDGEFLTLLGPSGCGKTTTLRIIAGLVDPDEGEVLLDGVAVQHLPAHRRQTAMVFQSYALFPHMTVSENIGFGLRMRALPGDLIQQRVGEALALVELEGLSDRYPRQLSGGQQQRVAVARAIVTRPKGLLFDEPLSNLDGKLGVRMGEVVTLSFRPEDVRIGRYEGTAVTGRVLHASYLGSVTDYVVESGGITLRVHEAGGAARAPGEEITITLPATAAIVRGG